MGKKKNKPNAIDDIINQLKKLQEQREKYIREKVSDYFDLIFSHSIVSAEINTLLKKNEYHNFKNSFVNTIINHFVSNGFSITRSKNPLSIGQEKELNEVLADYFSTQESHEPPGLSDEVIREVFNTYFDPILEFLKVFQNQYSKILEQVEILKQNPELPHHSDKRLKTEIGNWMETLYQENKILFHDKKKRKDKESGWRQLVYNECTRLKREKYSYLTNKEFAKKVIDVINQVFEKCGIEVKEKQLERNIRR